MKGGALSGLSAAETYMADTQNASGPAQSKTAHR
jgi:hypothetical protein